MDIATLAAENAALRGQLADVLAKFAAQSVQLAKVLESNEALALELAKLKRQVFGPKSERRRQDDVQVQMPFGTASAVTDEAVPLPSPVTKPPPRPAPHGRRTFAGPPDEVIAAARPSACPRCNGALRDAGTATADRWDWRPGQFVHVRISRPKCACDACGTIETVPEPAGFALPRSIVGNGLAAHIVVDKSSDHLPLNRQVARFEREGLELSLSTVCDVFRATADLVAPLVAVMKEEQIAESFIQGDDTGMPVLDGTRGKTGTGRLWVYASLRHVVYDFTATKAGAGPASYLRGFKGVLLADGGSEFNEAVRASGLTRAGCWSHARRYFFDARETSPALANEAIALIGVLFDIEREKMPNADAATRCAIRAIETRAALDVVKAWLLKHVHGLRPKSAIGQAVNYALNQWEFLEACALHPEIPIHNNLSELQLRRPVVGRKNWLFAGSEGGATAAARLYSLVGSCKIHGLDPWNYLHDMLGRINDHSIQRLTELTPAAYAGK